MSIVDFQIKFSK